MEPINRIKELIEVLVRASDAYYNKDCPIMSDKRYDELYDELCTLEKESGIIMSASPTQRVQGSILSKFKKVTHSKPMLSADKTKDPEVIKQFLKDMKWYCSYKLDGLTLVVKYNDGKMISAITRGNGTIGEDVTENAKVLSNLPLTIPFTGYLEIRGECVMGWKQFNIVNSTLEEPYSHPRNLAAGTIRQLDTSIVKNRKLSYVVFEVVDGIPLTSKWAQLNELDKMGFTTVERTNTMDVDYCVNTMQPIVKDNVNYPDYPSDGLIFEIDDQNISKTLGATAHHENCRMALKWKDSPIETILRDVIWETGKSGVVTPVAIFDQVDLGGALTTRATLHNLGIVRGLQLGLGDTITVYRANMVIPKVDDNLTRSDNLVIPDKCPSCGETLVDDKSDNSEFLVCPNKHCKAKTLAKFSNFCSRNCANIEGLSEKTLECLLNNNYVSTFKDLYHLNNIKDTLKNMSGFGDTSIENVLKAIEKSRNIKLENYINALGIDGIGLSAAKLLSKKFNGNYDEFFNSLKNGYDCREIDGFGDSAYMTLRDWITNISEEDSKLAEEFTFVVESKPPVNANNNSLINGKRFCITGSFAESRDVLTKKLESLGGIFVSGVSKKLDILFAGTSAGSKLDKALSLGVTVINEEDMYTYLK